ncbi:MAG: SDR family NAD(P)-dependent oxidoreductase, partial [Chloroflexota bacterium]
MTAKRRALVTGGSRGIGRCIAETLAREGCDVGFFYHGDADEAGPVIAGIEKLGRKGWSRVGDVRDSRQVNHAVESLVAQWGGIDVLVNNAGIVRDQVIWKMTDDEWRDVLDVDLTGMFHCCRAVVPAMRKSGWGAIVN